MLTMLDLSPKFSFGLDNEILFLLSSESIIDVSLMQQQQ